MLPTRKRSRLLIGPTDGEMMKVLPEALIFQSAARCTTRVGKAKISRCSAKPTASSTELSINYAFANLECNALHPSARSVSRDYNRAQLGKVWLALSQFPVGNCSVENSLRIVSSLD
jgi:hypothetical protein